MRRHVKNILRLFRLFCLSDCTIPDHYWLRKYIFNTMEKLKSMIKKYKYFIQSRRRHNGKNILILLPYNYVIFSENSESHRLRHDV